MYQNNTYVAFDGTNDIHYYRLMTAWKKKDSNSFNFYDAHDINTARDSSEEESIKKQLRERINSSKVFVLLIGQKTKYLTKFVKWEIESAIRLQLPIICVNLNGNRYKDILCPVSLENQLAIFIPFELKIMQYSFDNWPDFHYRNIKENKLGAYYWKSEVYNLL